MLFFAEDLMDLLELPTEASIEVPIYKETEDGEMEEIGSEEFTEVVDYSNVGLTFCSTFIEVATALVPVRTGFLRSTIDSRYSGTYVEAEAGAEYAEYVEYGTSRQPPQPYFEPALYAALDAAIGAANAAYQLAYEAVYNMAAAYMEGVMAGLEAMGFGFPLSFLGGFLALWAMFPVALLMYGVMSEIGSALMWQTQANSFANILDIEAGDLIIEGGN